MEQFTSHSRPAAITAANGHGRDRVIHRGADQEGLAPVFYCAPRDESESHSHSPDLRGQAVSWRNDQEFITSLCRLGKMQGQFAVSFDAEMTGGEVHSEHAHSPDD